MRLDEQTMERAVKAYSLNGFPFALRELNPLENREDVQLVSWVDGWKSARQLEADVAERAQRSQPLLLVIAGGSGTGRSSLVNYFVHLWLENRQGDGVRPIIASFNAGTYNADTQLLEWADSIESLVEDADIQLNEVTVSTFANLRSDIPNQVAGSLKYLLRRIVADLKSPRANAALVGIIHGVGDKSFLELATRFLPSVDALLVMTVDGTKSSGQTVLDKADELVEPLGAVVRLSELTGEECKTLVKDCWRRSAGDMKSPWSDEGLEHAFDPLRRPLRDVIDLMASLLVAKSMDVAESDRWPVCETLGYDDATLVTMLNVLDRLIGRRQ